MMTLGAIGFLQPWILLGLASLPAIWWLLRLTPPSPHHVVFPPTRLLKDLKSTEETPAHSPWWLTALRMLLAALIVLALARPVLNPDRQSFTGTGPLLLVIDNGWAAASHWPERREAIDAAIDRAGRDGRTIVLAPSAPGDPLTGPVAAEQARERAAGLTPQPYAPDRKALAATLERELGGKTDYSVVWLSDGLDYGEGPAFAESLTKLAGRSGSILTLRPDGDNAALALDQATGDGSELAARVLSGAEGPRSGVVKALTGRGEPLGEAPFAIPQGAREARAHFELPLEIRNQVARLEIAGERSAGAVHLLDGRSEWRRVGIISGESREAAQPLLSPLYYVQRALTPYADVVTPKEANVALGVHELIDDKVSTIVLADIGKLVAGTEEELDTWLKSGGVLIRFAGPRLEQGGDELLPVALRRGGRSLGGSLSWSTPQPLAPFEDSSPFRGLTVPDDVKVNRQVLADPTVAMDAQVWARLADGTPLVTASRQGEGWIVLFHVTANSDWSNLPLSGLFVEMLRRVSTLGPSKISPAPGESSGAGWRGRQGNAQRDANDDQRCLRGRIAADPDPRRLRPIDVAAAAGRAALPGHHRQHRSRPRPSAGLLRPRRRSPRLQRDYRQDRAQAAQAHRRNRPGERLRHAQARAARALALPRGARLLCRRRSDRGADERGPRPWAPGPCRRGRAACARAVAWAAWDGESRGARSHHER